MNELVKRKRQIERPVFMYHAGVNPAYVLLDVPDIECIA